jgi:acyl-[acyl-carrier-protein]-phospholipid O-acyltransferase/long-chain-fatty-acid--[acyl-carrier-protein] ligase
MKSWSFVGYLLMTFLTAVNDSMFRWLIVPIAKQLYHTRRGYTLEDAESLVLPLGLCLFMLPFAVFAPWTGWLADRFSKRSSIIALKVVEVVLMAVGVWTIQAQSIPGMFVVLFLIGTQAAMIGTAKFGIIPELVQKREISAANGFSGLATLIGVIAGTVAGYGLADLTLSLGLVGLAWSALSLLSVAALGTAGAMLMRHVPAADPTDVFPRNLIVDSWRDIKLVMNDRAILRVTMGIVFFWALASLAQMNIDVFVNQELADNVPTRAVADVETSGGETGRFTPAARQSPTDRQSRDVKADAPKINPGPFMAMLVIGVGLGSLLAGWWSNGRVELGMVPFGTMMMALACILLYFCKDSPILAGAMLMLIGLGGGLFNVPLNAYIQERCPHNQLGSVLAAGQQLTAMGMLFAAGFFWLLQEPMNMTAPQIFLVCGLGIIPIVVYVLWLIPQATIRFFVWLLSRSVYRVRTYGIENIPEQGSALLVANHVSWIDGILILLSSSRPIRMVAYADYVQGRIARWLSNLFGIIPIRAGDGPRALVQSLNTARQALIDGQLVCIFAEGRITRTGQLLKFERGMLKILKDTGAPVVPVCLDELWGSIFSYERGKFIWKKPKYWPYPVSISFGAPIPKVETTDVVRNAVLELSAQSVLLRKERSMIPARRLIRQCRLAWKRRKVADSGGTELTGGRLLTGSLAFHGLLTKQVLKPDVQYVGLLLPPSVGGVLANTALTLAGKVTVNLNYTLTDDVVNYCIREAGIKQVITSRAFMEKKPMKLDAELVFLEDLKTRVTGFDKFRALLTARWMPAGLLAKQLKLDHIKADDPLTVIFTSGSTGEPKGVVLSQHNIASNVDAVIELMRLTSADGLLGVLPFFHSFGFTVTMWLPLAADPSAVYHFNPLDSRTVGELVEKYGSTILAATPTFLRSYLKRCTVEQFRTLNLVIVGAEKMPDDLRVAFKEKFGFEPTEGYGTTEMSPVASFNIPESRMGDEARRDVGTKHGTVGRVIPGCAAAVFDPETNVMLGNNQEGLLKIKGPNIMLGYLNQPKKTAELIQDGWYNSGDMAVIDDDGFIRITGRMSRFSKIGGEMVPHILVEQALSKIFDSDLSDEPGILCAVTSVPDEKKGERLIVLHKPTKKPIRDVIDQLQAAGLPNLFIPSSDSFIEVEQIPLLGTGKLDLRGMKDLAMQKCGRQAGGGSSVR